LLLAPSCLSLSWHALLLRCSSTLYSAGYNNRTPHVARRRFDVSV
jgi:hypothetical protein